MRILFDSFGPPFFLAHGGEQVQVNQTVEGLRANGLDVDYARWWDSGQTCDIVHSFGVPNSAYINFAKSKGIRVVSTTLFTATCNRSSRQLDIQGAVISMLDRLPMLPPWSSIRSQLKWECFRQCDLNIVGLEVEAEVLRKVYSVADEKIRIVPLGLSEAFLNAGHGNRDGDELITTGTITERKKSLELARMAKAAKVPIRFVGKPYAPGSDYWREFELLIDGKYVKHTPHTESVAQMISLLQSSRGYVLYSDYENWCLSAHEAVACGLPILIPEQPWSREIFGDQASYFKTRDEKSNTRKLKEFHEAAISLPAPTLKPHSWTEVGAMLNECYKEIH
jgi:glycosyltransferase involved in cell wall biosynthesis